MRSLLEDPWVAALIDEALDKHRHALTERQIQAFREKMAWTFANHPAAQRALERARRTADERSGERLKDGTSVPSKPDDKTGEGGRS